MAVQKFSSTTLDSLGPLPARASASLIKDELLLPKWSPAGLDFELKRYIWKDDREDIKVKDLWELFGTYVYLPRLRDANTLLEAIRDGATSEDYFGYATSKTPEGEYAGLHFGERPPSVFLDDLGVVVRPDIARAALLKKAPPEATDRRPKPEDAAVKPTGGQVPGTEHEAKVPRRFYGRVKLSPQRLGSGAGQVGEEVLQHLAGLVGSKVEVELDISVEVPEGIPDHVVRTVTENARTLKFEDFGFERE